MAYQASRLKSHEPVGPIRGVTSSASSVVGDALDLAELQAKLLKADAASCLGHAKLPIVGLILSLGLLLSSLPVVALGLASFVSWLLDWPVWTTQLLVGGLLSALGLGIAYWGVMRLKSSLSEFSASAREASANMKWLRQTLSRSFVSTNDSVHR